MKSSQILNNLTKLGVGLGLVFPIASIIIDLIYHDYQLTISNLEQLYKTNPLHWIILSAPIVLGLTCYLLGKRITEREHFLQQVTEKEKGQTQLIEQYIGELGNGNLNITLSDDFESESLSTMLNSLRDNLSKEKEESERRQWINEGLADFGDILRSHSNIKELSAQLISALVKYLKYNQGGFFLIQESEGRKHLELMSCYAYERKKFQEKKVDPGEGLLGQCFLEKRTLLLYEVPENYVKITSGLGDAAPNCLLLSPLKTDTGIEGVIELAGFRKLKPYEIEFIEKVCESIASVITNVKNNEHTNKLLQSSQEQAEIMRSQEEEMRQNMEELSATQEEMQRKENEFLKKIDAYKLQFGEIE